MEPVQGATSARSQSQGNSRKKGATASSCSSVGTKAVSSGKDLVARRVGMTARIGTASAALRPPMMLIGAASGQDKLNCGGFVNGSSRDGSMLGRASSDVAAPTGADGPVPASAEHERIARAAGRLNPDCLVTEILVQALTAVLAAGPGSLDAAERH
jgi:hypothetical protein